MTGIRNDVASVLPLLVTGVGITADVFFNVYGEGWALGINCNWVILKGDEHVATWDSDEVEMRTAVNSLKGKSIISVDIDDDIFDPIFYFDEDIKVIVQADTDLDPWVFRAEGMPIVLVGYGPASHAEWMETQQSAQE